MNLDQIETKCFILALFIRDDDERFLLGTRAFEFIDKQLHFSANTYQNDIVEVQGNDGIMLAGQVRRATLQSFDGFIGDSSVDRSSIEQYRREFLKFFRKNHYYKVVYIFPDGTAIQRRQGFIVEAPEAKELYQLFPTYHIGMNFEDINYYTYEEDSEGQEIYGESVGIPISGSATGGLIWSSYGAITLSGEGSNFTLTNTVNGNSISNLQLKGDTTQQTYSGKNLYDFNSLTIYREGSVITRTDSGFYATIPTPDGTVLANYYQSSLSNPVGTFTFSFEARIQNADTASLSFSGSSDPYVWGVRGPLKNGSGTVVTEEDRTLSADWKKYCFTVTTTTSQTWTVARAIHLYFTDYSNSPVFETRNWQIESGSTATSYEPYVGGITAPNPSYPQTVNTVTGRQVVTIGDGDSQSQEYEVNLGKNLLDMDYTENGGIDANGVDIVVADNWRTIGYIDAEPNTTYTYSMNGTLSAGYALRFYQYDANHNFISPRTVVTNDKLTITTTVNTRYIRLTMYSGAGTMTESIARGAKLMLELGSTVTPYASYFTPIELCKIDTYQDYIYKSGADWYLHKETGKVVFDGTENWAYGQLAGCYSLLKTALQGLDLPAASINYAVTTFTPTPSTPVEIGKSYAGGGYFNVNYDGTSTAAGLADFKTWLSSSNSFLYGPLATATDTQITNAALISQLEALDGATTYDDMTIFTVTSENKLGILSLSTEGWAGGGVVWDNIGATWEDGTGGGPTTISVDSIDNVYPIVTITGPATDPQIADLTTNTTLSYTGSITSSQTLKIDMFNKTATLNGVSVLENISGDWLYLKPGANRITYTPSNADAPQATIWWQEIVG